MKKTVNWLLAFCISIAACTSNTHTTNALGLDVSLSADKKSVLIKNMPSDLLSRISSDRLQQTAFFALYPIASNPEMQGQESPLQGSFSQQGDLLVFTPDTSLSKGTKYRAEVYAQSRDFSLINLLKKQEQLGGNKPTEFILSY
ncbi:MAG: hypothetical protein ACKOWL_06060 [Sphingobacteriaceae bacterium]